jgi:hypothetical protein
LSVEDVGSKRLLDGTLLQAEVEQDDEAIHCKGENEDETREEGRWRTMSDEPVSTCNEKVWFADPSWIWTE